MEGTLDAVLRAHEPAQDLHVFGYGSLMWNAAMEIVQASVTRVQGWHRPFWFRTILGRGARRHAGAGQRRCL
ncbi:MAG: ChaC family protein [Ramlibacter sp.]|nr:ChaC family protein [Ramlibacter sp.]